MLALRLGSSSRCGVRSCGEMCLRARLDTSRRGRLGVEWHNRPWRCVSRLPGNGGRGRVSRQSRFESGRLLQINYFLCRRVWSQCTRQCWLWMFLPSPLAGSRNRRRAKILATLDSKVRKFRRFNYFGRLAFCLHFEVMIFDLCTLVSCASTIHVGNWGHHLPFGSSLSPGVQKFSQRPCLRYQNALGRHGSSSPR